MEIGLIICPPTSFSDHRTSASEKICSTPRKTFFNSIDPKRTWRRGDLEGRRSNHRKVQSLLCAVLRTFPASPQRIADFGPTGHKSHRGHLTRLPAAIFGLADLGSQSERDDVSTYRKAQKYNRETPNQSSTLSLSNSATRIMSLLRAGQTFQQATQGQTLRLCPNQGWPKHRPDTQILAKIPHCSA